MLESFCGGKGTGYPLSFGNISFLFFGYCILLPAILGFVLSYTSHSILC